jgi:broad specificity phosphatase PhoE
MLAAALILSALPVDGRPRSKQAAPSSDPCDQPATTLLIVRHADRAGKADSLSAAGQARAHALAQVVQAEDIRAIYHSDTHRTRQTAAPAVVALGIMPREYPAKEVDALVEGILGEHEGDTVLIVGHSNTVPQIIAAAGGPVIPDLPEDEYDQLFVVVVAPCRRGPARLLTLQYGEASP